MHLNHFVWKTQYKLGFAVIDRQHMDFLQIMDDLYEAIMQDAEKPELLRLFDLMAAHTRTHFGTEEGYFSQYNYDPEERHRHIADHSKFLTELDEMRPKMDSSDKEACFRLVDLLEDHLIFHLADMDKKYITCFREHGLT